MRKSKGIGEIVEVEGGGGLVRSLRRKDRHSKVCTSKGPRDRRLRLSANTAIQFYDVQDRLGYDRPSKAIDWLMKEAKPVIDALKNDNHHQDTSEAFHRAGGERNQEISIHPKIGGFGDYPMGLIDLRGKRQENPSEEVTPMGFTWNQSYNSGDSFAFVDREPLQSSYPTLIHTFSSEFENDEEFLGFNFQQENRVEEEEKCKLVSKNRRSSATSYQIL